MPAFAGQLTPQQIQDVAAYVVQATERLILPPDFPRGIEALACDLDRTLIGEDAELRPRTRAAIAAARAAGLHVIVVTGRMFRSVRPYLEAAGLDDPVVCYQGAVVADPVSGRVPPARADPARARARGDRRRRGRGLPAELLRRRRALRRASTRRIRGATRRSSTSRCTQSGRCSTGSESRRRSSSRSATRSSSTGWRRGSSRRFGGRMYISKSLPYFLEFASPDVTKGSGLAFVAERLGFSQERDRRVRRRRERRRAARVGGLRGRGRERARRVSSRRPTSSARPSTRKAWRR